VQDQIEQAARPLSAAGDDTKDEDDEEAQQNLIYLTF
jgi:hypothetical protein